MKAFQGTIGIREGIIQYIIPSEGFVKIINLDTNQELNYCSAFAYPGFVDSHGHLHYLAEKLSGTDLTSCSTAEEVAQTASESPLLKSHWIIAHGWNSSIFSNSTKSNKILILDKYFPDTPVCFFSADLHSVWINSAAIHEVNFEKIPNNLKGSILLDKFGKPDGIFKDDAALFILNKIPHYTDTQYDQMIYNAQSELLKYGITQVSEMEMTYDLYKSLIRLEKSHRLKIKVNGYIKGSEYFQTPYLFKKLKSQKLSVKGIKLFTDGSLGSRGAALIEPYSDDPANYGKLLYNFDSLLKSCCNILANGFDIAVHAIGDAANRMTLSVFADLIQKGISSNQILRIEHCQLIRPKDLKYFACSTVQSPIAASLQPLHCSADSGIIYSRISKRQSYSYPWKSILDKGILILGGSDFPVVSHDPLLGIYEFTHRTHSGKAGSFYPDEIISLDDAIKAYTENPGKVANFKDRTGKIEVGYGADLVILNDTIENICSKNKYIYNPNLIKNLLVN